MGWLGHMRFTWHVDIKDLAFGQHSQTQTLCEKQGERLRVILPVSHFTGGTTYLCLLLIMSR